MIIIVIFPFFYLSHRCITTIKMCALSDFLLRRDCFSLFFHEMLLFCFSFVYWMHTCSWFLRGLILSSTLFAISLHSSSFFIIFIFSSSWTFLLTLLLLSSSLRVSPINLQVGHPIGLYFKLSYFSGIFEVVCFVWIFQQPSRQTSFLCLSSGRTVCRFVLVCPQQLANTDLGHQRQH